jgi:hypothetical protein
VAPPKTRFKVIQPKEYKISFQRDIQRESYSKNLNDTKRPMSNQRKVTRKEVSPKLSESDSHSYTPIPKKLENQQKEEKYQEVIKSVSKERSDISRLLVRLQ